jgi:nucleoside-diphosphate-sugar epimerase
MPTSVKKVLCSGGTGFVGQWMAQTAPSNVMAWMMNKEQYETRAWDIMDWDYIVHLAPISPDQVIDYAQHHRIKVLFASSGAVYEGKGKYADDKRLWETRCNQSNADIVTARIFATSGLPFQKNKALSNFIQSALKGEPIQVWGDGSTVRSYLYGEDAGRWMWKILLDGEGVYNVGSIVPYTMKMVAEIIQSRITSTIEYIPHEETLTPIHYLPDTDHAEELDLHEKVFLTEAIERMIKDAPMSRL